MIGGVWYESGGAGTFKHLTGPFAEPVPPPHPAEPCCPGVAARDPEAVLGFLLKQRQAEPVLNGLGGAEGTSASGPNWPLRIMVGAGVVLTLTLTLALAAAAVRRGSSSSLSGRDRWSPEDWERAEWFEESGRYPHALGSRY